MIQRRGFLGKLVALLGLSGLPVRTKTSSCDPFAGLGEGDFTIEQGPPVSIAELLPFPPGTVRLGKARQNSDGSWTIPFVHMEGGWTLTGETTLWCKTGFELIMTTPGYKGD